jgi:aspartyl-tRNA synthetase
LTLEVLNVAGVLPFPFHRQNIPIGEETLMKYRYLDLRQPTLQYNIRLRSKVAKAARDFLHSNDFVEIETPTLFKSTPEGAREFLVATRNLGKFYRSAP